MDQKSILDLKLDLINRDARMGTGKEKKAEVKILGNYCLKKMQYFPP